MLIVRQIDLNFDFEIVRIEIAQIGFAGIEIAQTGFARIGIAQIDFGLNSTGLLQKSQFRHFRIVTARWSVFGLQIRWTGRWGCFHCWLTRRLVHFDPLDFHCHPVLKHFRRLVRCFG